MISTRGMAQLSVTNKSAKYDGIAENKTAHNTFPLNHGDSTMHNLGA